MPDTYLSLTVDLPEGEAEALQDALHEAGALGLEVRDREGPLMPGVRAPAAGESIVVAFFDTRETAEEARAQVAEAFPSARLALEEQAQQDWSVAWREHVRAVQVGRLWVGPPWAAEGAPAGLVRVVVEPKMAFGTGDHPTTSLCLAALDAFLAERPGADVLDVGTGTGVLAIAAKKLGAGRVVGVDNDPVSVELARECAELNGVPGVELSGTPLEEVPGDYPLVLANILANTLIEMAPLLAARTTERLVLAGVLAHQEAEVAQAFRAQGLTQLEGARQGEWVRLDFRRDARR
jgi:ribosomal protein L11 methyltransferase